MQNEENYSPRYFTESKTCNMYFTLLWVTRCIWECWNLSVGIFESKFIWFLAFVDERHLFWLGVTRSRKTSSITPTCQVYSAWFFWSPVVDAFNVVKYAKVIFVLPQIYSWTICQFEYYKRPDRQERGEVFRRPWLAVLG